MLEKSDNNEEIVGFDLGTDGSGFESLIVKPDDNEKFIRTGKLYMMGSEVFMFTMNVVPQSVNSSLQKVGLKLDDIDLFIFHQASKLVFENLIRRLNIPEKKVFINLDKIGNTVSASIPIAIKDAVTDGRLTNGNTIMLAGFGVGLSWGTCIIKNWGI